MRIEQTHDVQMIRPLGERWATECHGAEYGIEVSVSDAVADLRKWLDTVPGTILLAYDGVELVGFFAVFAVPEFLAGQVVALERYWYAVPNVVRAGPALFRAAQRWAQENACSHLVISASHLASGQYEKVYRFCEKMGMSVLETAFIQKV